MNVSQEIKLGGRARLVLDANFVNLFDLKSKLDYYTVSPWRSGVTRPIGRSTAARGILRPR